MEELMDVIEKKLDEDFPNEFRSTNIYERVSYKIVTIAITNFKDELFDKAVDMARAIRDFGEEYDKV